MLKIIIIYIIVYSTSHKIGNFMNEPKIFWIYVFQVKMMLKIQNNKISLISLSKFPNIVRISPIFSDSVPRFHGLSPRRNICPLRTPSELGMLIYWQFEFLRAMVIFWISKLALQFTHLIHVILCLYLHGDDIIAKDSGYFPKWAQQYWSRWNPNIIIAKIHRINYFLMDNLGERWNGRALYEYF